ncbi:MAG: YcgN family cysteine cluster protein [Proteobacteria bacterium]|nr:YcgN family cysteine cluster protein [Pseudomonadota bacterium]
MDQPFWKRKTLSEMTAPEWESLCDGCAQCCLIKLEDPDTEELTYTRVSCRLLDEGSCSCSRYETRQRHVPDCVALTPENVRTIPWLPPTCAYRLVAEGRDLYWWHPLVSGSAATVHQAGVSVRGKIVSESDVADPDLPDYEITLEEMASAVTSWGDDPAS